MTKQEQRTIENIKYAMELSQKYAFNIMQIGDCLELFATTPGFHYTTYAFDKNTSMRDIGIFLQGYDAAVKYLSKDSD